MIYLLMIFINDGLDAKYVSNQKHFTDSIDISGFLVSIRDKLFFYLGFLSQALTIHSWAWEGSRLTLFLSTISTPPNI